MSVTFFVPEAPVTRRRVPCDSPSLGLECAPGAQRCGYCEDGLMWERKSACPEANFSNENTRALLRLLQLPQQPDGTVEARDVSSVIRRLIRIRNTTGGLPLVRAPFEEPRKRQIKRAGPGLFRMGYDAPRVLWGGVTPARAEEQLKELQAVFACAAQARWSVAWA